MRRTLIIAAVITATLADGLSRAADGPTSRWPQFRGPNGQGVALDDTRLLAVTFNGSDGVIWKTPLLPGHSSPCVWDDRIFLTAAEDEGLYTICLDAATGRVLWRERAPGDRMGLPAVRFHVGASLDALAHERWEEAKRRLALELGRTVTDADLMLYGVELALRGRGRRGSRGRTPYQVVVHQCPTCEEATVQTGEGPERLDPGTVAMVACDGTRVDPARPPEKLDQPTPPWLRDAVLARDSSRCRSCGLRWDLMVHHLVFRARGGPTSAENLVSLCGRCHSLVHSGLLRIEGSPGTGLQFMGRDGRAVGDPTLPSGHSLWDDGPDP